MYFLSRMAGLGMLIFHGGNGYFMWRFKLSGCMLQVLKLSNGEFMVMNFMVES